MSPLKNNASRFTSGSFELALYGVSSCRIGFIANQKEVVYPHNIWVAMTPSDISCHDGDYCGSKGSQFCKIVYSLIKDWYIIYGILHTVPSGSMKTNQHGRHFEYNINLSSFSCDQRV